jgi:hypothetical protein
MAPTGQAGSQPPSYSHRSGLARTAFPPTSASARGRQAVTHSPQPVQRISSISGKVVWTNVVLLNG